MGSRTHYEVLGVNPSADRSTIEKAYRRKVRFVHPDVNDDPDSLERFYTIQRAYESLRDPDKRREYDSQLAQKSAAPESPVVAKRAAARRRASEAREKAGVASPGGFVYTAGPFWDPASNPVLRRKIQKSRRRKWLARLETAMLTINVALLLVAVVAAGLLLFDPIDTSPIKVDPSRRPALGATSSDLDPSEVEQWLQPHLPTGVIDVAPDGSTKLPPDADSNATDIAPFNRTDSPLDLLD